MVVEVLYLMPRCFFDTVGVLIIGSLFISPLKLAGPHYLANIGLITLVSTIISRDYNVFVFALCFASSYVGWLIFSTVVHRIAPLEAG